MKSRDTLAILAITAAAAAVTRGDVTFGDFESGTAPGFGALTQSSGVQPWVDPVHGNVITAPSGPLAGSKVLELTGTESFNFGLSTGAALGFNFLSQSLRSAFLANSQLEFDWYPVPNGGTAGFSQLYNVILNSQGGGFTAVGGYNPAPGDANCNQFYFTGYSGVLHHVVINYTTYKNTVLASANPDAGGWLELGIQPNAGGGAPADYYLDNFKLTVAPINWAVDSDGSWSVGTNWVGSTAPNAIDVVAGFGTVITASRIVTVDSNQTVGAINFSSPISYSVAGTASITMDVSSGPAQINATAGSHTISAPVVLNDDLAVTSAAGAGVALTGNLTATGRTITKAGAGSVQFENVRASGLSVTAGTAKISSKGTANSAGGTSVVQSLSIGAGASLDLTNNSAIIDYTTLTTQVSDLRGHLKAGRLFTSAASPANTRLAYLDNATLTTPKTTFAGQSVDASSVLIKFTYAGDGDLDGDADGVDIGTWATNFTGELGGGASATRVWSQGDWDYDGDVDGVDAGLWATAFTGELGGAGLGSLVLNDPAITPQAAAILQGMGITVVPEPASFSIVGLVLVAASTARRRRFR